MYSSNQYNYATPLSGVNELLSTSSNVQDVKYFTLFDNILDGSYVPITGDVGLWGNTLSDANGVLSEPLIIQIEGMFTINAFRLVGSQYCYPVAFTVDFYSNSELLYTLSETSNNDPEYSVYFTGTLNVVRCVITVTKISAANSVARLYNVYNPGYVKRRDTLSIDATINSIMSDKITLHRSDDVKVRAAGSSHIQNIIGITHDTLSVDLSEDPVLTNVHSRMKDPSRSVYGKVDITYTDPMLEVLTDIITSSDAYNSNKEQLIDTHTSSADVYFSLYDNDLTGAYVVSGANSQVGWVSADLSDSSGHFNVSPYVRIVFSAKPINSLVLSFDASHDNLVRDFEVVIATKSGQTYRYEIEGNEHETAEIPIQDTITDATTVQIFVSRVSKPFSPAVIMDVPISSTFLYKGYKDTSNLVSIDLLEELTYEDEVEALGGVRANEVTVTLDNSTKEFFFNSGSAVSQQLKRNRKIVPQLGVEVIPGEIEWHKLGTFWSYKWDVPVNGLTATVVGFDTIGLLGTTDFYNHHVQVNKSIGELIEYVLNDARVQLPFIEHSIDAALYDEAIPYAWFERSSHAAALRKISLCYPMHIYCDRQGVICAKPQKLHLDHFYDEWSDSTNVLDKRYSSLYTALPNIVNVTINSTGVEETELVRDEMPFVVDGTRAVTLVFNVPFISDLSVEVICDEGITYSYVEYAWGIVCTFQGAGSVQSIVCFGTGVKVLNQSTLERKDSESVLLNGAITRQVESDFIQTQGLAKFIIDRIFSLSEYDKYDANVDYRGDIALSINDPILLHDGIAPDNRYNIKRHQLTWNGALTGTADLNT